MSEEHRFTADLYELPSNVPGTMNVALDVPAPVSEAFARRGHVPVVGTVDGAALTGTLVPRGQGRHRLFLDAETRRAIGRGPGDAVEVRIRYDPADRTPPTPTDLRRALREAGVDGAWRRLPPSRRKEYLVVLEDAERPETRRRRIGRIVALLGDQGRSGG